MSRPTDHHLEQILMAWYWQTMAYRTEHASDDINWVDPASRICWSEVQLQVEKIGLWTGDSWPDRRLRFDKLQRQGRGSVAQLGVDLDRPNEQALAVLDEVLQGTAEQLGADLVNWTWQATLDGRVEWIRADTPNQETRP